MKIAIKKDEGNIPGGGYHYMTFPVPMETQGMHSVAFKMMGYEIIEVDDVLGEKIIKEARQALAHQVEVAHLYEDPRFRAKLTLPV